MKAGDRQGPLVGRALARARGGRAHHREDRLVDGVGDEQHGLQQPVGHGVVRDLDVAAQPSEQHHIHPEQQHQREPAHPDEERAGRSRPEVGAGESQQRGTHAEPSDRQVVRGPAGERAAEEPSRQPEWPQPRRQRRHDHRRGDQPLYDQGGRDPRGRLADRSHRAGGVAPQLGEPGQQHEHQHEPGRQRGSAAQGQQRGHPEDQRRQRRLPHLGTQVDPRQQRDLGAPPPDHPGVEAPGRERAEQVHQRHRVGDGAEVLLRQDPRRDDRPHQGGDLPDDLGDAADRRVARRPIGGRADAGGPLSRHVACVHRVGPAGRALP